MKKLLIMVVAFIGLSCTFQSCNKSANKTKSEDSLRVDSAAMNDSIGSDSIKLDSAINDSLK
jgi:hypothetical protein